MAERLRFSAMVHADSQSRLVASRRRSRSPDLPPLQAPQISSGVLLVLKPIVWKLMLLFLPMVSSLPFMTGRDLQRISGNHTSKVGHLSGKEITELVATHQLPAGLDNQEIPTIEDALLRISSSVRGIILDVKVGPPAYEKGLAEDILSVVGYIVMNDPSTGITSSLFRIKRASVVGVYHPLINNELMSALRGRKKEVYAWTVDDEASMKRMLYNRVDGIVTGDPALAQVVMHDIRTQCVQEGFSLP
ncbi:Glycerophosphodiester phosphodiesterase GDPD4-like protein [Drosera capensis]